VEKSYYDDGEERSGQPPTIIRRKVKKQVDQRTWDNRIISMTKTASEIGIIKLIIREIIV
jgi:hypothetical protein